MPKRSAGGNAAKRSALLHALAHIELNAIDLAWDLIARFGKPDMPRAFFDDWVKVADEEALHFELLSARLQELGARPMAISPPMMGSGRRQPSPHRTCSPASPSWPLVLEARGLDVTPATVADMQRAGDEASAALARGASIATRSAMSRPACAGSSTLPAKPAKIRSFIGGHCCANISAGVLKPPFNDTARAAAGMPSAYYQQ